MGRNNKSRQKFGKDDQPAASGGSTLAGSGSGGKSSSSAAATPTAAIPAGYHVNGSGAIWKNLGAHVWRKDNILVVNFRDEREILDLPGESSATAAVTAAVAAPHHAHPSVGTAGSGHSTSAATSVKPPAPRSTTLAHQQEQQQHQLRHSQQQQQQQPQSASHNGQQGSSTANSSPSNNHNGGKSVEMQSFLNDQLAKMRKGEDRPSSQPYSNNSNANRSNAAHHVPLTSSSQTPPSAPRSPGATGLQGVELLPAAVDGGHKALLQPIPAAFDDPLWGSSRATTSTAQSDKSVELDTELLLSGLLGDLRREMEMQTTPPAPPTVTAVPPTATMIPMSGLPPGMTAMPGPFAVTSGNTTPPMQMAQLVQLSGKPQSPQAQWGTFMVANQAMAPQMLQGPKGFSPSPTTAFQIAGPKFATPQAQPFQQYITQQPSVIYPYAPKGSLLMPQGFHIVHQMPPTAVAHAATRQGTMAQMIPVAAGWPTQATAVPAGMKPPVGAQVQYVQVSSPSPGPGDGRSASSQGVNVSAAPFVPKPG